MVETPHATLSDSEDRRLGALTLPLTMGGGAVAVAGLIAAILASVIAEHGLRQLLFAWLVNFLFFLSISLGAMCFLMWQHVSGAGWVVTVRRLCEVLAANTWIMGLLGLPIVVAVVFGQGLLHPWTDPNYVEHHSAVAGKLVYLNAPFFAIRYVVYFAVWIALARMLYRGSVRQDETGDPALTVRLSKVSAPGLVLFAFTVTFATVDWVMSLDPMWFSTVIGVYYFSSAIVGFLGLLILITVLLQQSGRVTDSINVEHYQDLGKWLFAFVFFWAYIAFSQYMLIWYGNISEETQWYLRHGASTAAQDVNVWSAVLIVLLFGHFVIPFLGLLSRHVKRRVAALAFWAGWMLVMHWLGMVWLVAPEYSHGDETLGPGFIVMLVGTLLGMGGLFVAAAAKRAEAASLVPEQDPRVREALTFENF